MNLTTALYLADLVGNIGTISKIFWVVCLIFFIFSSIASAIENSTNYDKGPPPFTVTKASYKMVKIPLFIAIGISIVTPSSKTIYMIAAVKAGQVVAENPKVQDLSDKVLKLINEKLEAELEKKK